MTIINANSTCTASMKPCNIEKLSLASGRSRADLRKLLSVQRGTTNQAPIHIRHRKKIGSIAGLDAAAVEDPQLAGYISILGNNPATDEQVHRLGLLWR